MFEQYRYWEEIQQVFEFLAYVLNNSPDEDFIIRIKELILSTDTPSSTESLHPGRNRIADYFKEHHDTQIDELILELSVDWTRLFRGVSPGNGPPPPYEGVYRRDDGLGVKIVQQVNKEYFKYGLSISEQHRDRSDYLGYELDFLRHLSEQVIQVQEGGQIKESKKYQQDLCKFMREHLSTWVGDFCAQAAEYAQTGFYSGFLLLLQETVADVTANLCSMSLSEESYEKHE